MEHIYDPHAVETKWRQVWSASELYRTPEIVGQSHIQKYYCLDFFPYPSGYGLHVGHCRNYVPTDVISRYHRMKGDAVLHPMGWDAFGLPAENEAIDKGVHPLVSTKRNTTNFKLQMDLIGASYDWSKEINSSDPEYYHWTQWFFLLLYRRGLAYRAPATVNWCETDQTVLANEEVEEGLCWRCHNPVVKRTLTQWAFRITAYADELLSALDTIDWPEHIKAMQHNWIGRSEGAEVTFRTESGAAIPVFTTRPDTLWGATFMVLAPEHRVVNQVTVEAQQAEVAAYIAQAGRKSEAERTAVSVEKTGVFTGTYAVNPVNDERIPVWVADYVLANYGTGAIMAVPAHDPRDFEFARKYGLPMRVVVQPQGETGSAETLQAAHSGAGVLVNSGPLNGVSTQESVQRTVDWLVAHGLGTAKVNYKMRDWLISRQRYWGAPIPIIHCPRCGEVPVPDEQLPVRLPDIEHYQPSGDGRSPLANVPEWVHVPCPRCGEPAQRETDTMGGFACSSWYFLRFPHPHYPAGPFDPEAVNRWLPVDLYVGGAEHAVMHLLYARFWTKVMADEELIGFREPFPHLRSQGQLHGPDGKRMSKSRGNVITPDEMVAKYGADVLRLFVMFMAPFENSVTWSEEGVAGIQRFLRRVWSIGTKDEGRKTKNSNPAPNEILSRTLYRTIQKVGNDIEAFKFNTAISSLMTLVNTLGDEANVDAETVDTLIRLVAPLAPFITEELWHIRHPESAASVHSQPWPDYDPALATEASRMLVVQVNGKVRDRISLDEQPSEEIEALALTRPAVQRALNGRNVARVIRAGVVVNIVTE